MTAAEPHDQLFRLASDAASIYDHARRWFLSGGPSTVPILVEGLDEPRLGSVAHWRILLLLRELALPSTLPAILKAFRAALREKNPIVLPGAMEALAVFDDNEATSALLSVLGSGDADFINHAAVLLGEKGGQRTIDALSALLTDADARARQSAVRGLLKIQTDPVRGILTRHRTTEKDPGVLKLLSGVK